PELTERDAEKIKAQSIKDFLDPKKSINNNLKNTVGALKTKKDGSCIFLQYENKISCNICNIYDFRPTLCNLYPFRIEKLDSNRIAFKFIPCCKGLKNPKGKVLDKEFFLENLKEAIKVFKISS
ncbi:MAG: YkgJ family cysteine cluster protein, partial [Candidatus Bathyarchaeota archaeon]